MIDRVGRRVLLWAGFAIMAAIMLLLTVTVQLKVTLFYFTPSIPGRPVKACLRNGEKHFFLKVIASLHLIILTPPLFRSPRDTITSDNKRALTSGCLD